MFLHPSVLVTVLSKLLHAITSEVKLTSYNHGFIMFYVNATNCEIIHRALWDDLVNLASDPRIMDKPWKVLGDFNQVLDLFENSTSIGFRFDRGISEF